MGLSCPSNSGSSFVEGTGTSLSTPIVASIVSGLTEKFGQKRICFYKALIISSAEGLGGSSQFDPYVQGFGVPNRDYALASPYSRTNLIADRYFDLDNLSLGHKYTFHFPPGADRIRVTVCFDVEPFLKAQELPYEIDIKLRKAATRPTTVQKPDKELPAGASNSKVYEYRVQRAGIGDWTVELFPRARPGLRAARLFRKRLEYCVVVTVYSSEGKAVYNQVKRYTRLSPTGVSNASETLVANK